MLLTTENKLNIYKDLYQEITQNLTNFYSSNYVKQNLQAKKKEFLNQVLNNEIDYNYHPNEDLYNDYLPIKNMYEILFNNKKHEFEVGEGVIEI
jgi:hypothetical protein